MQNFKQIGQIVLKLLTNLTFKVKRGQPYFQRLVSVPKGSYMQNFKQIGPELKKLLTNLDKVQYVFAHFGPVFCHLLENGLSNRIILFHRPP